MKSELYYVPCDCDEAIKLRKKLYDLSDGILLNVRGRDKISSISVFEMTYSAWEYGVASKFQRQLYLMWDDKVECYDIGVIDFINQLHFSTDSLTTNNLLSSSLSDYALEKHSDITPIAATEHTSDCLKKTSKVIILCHGFSPDCGPNYLFMSILKRHLESLGWYVIVPDFRPSYAYGPARGRSERVNMLMSTIIELLGKAACEDERPLTTILIGHSQGGAAIAQLCSNISVANGAKVKGIVMLGSESPIEQLQTDCIAINDVADITNQSSFNTRLIHTSRPQSIPSENILLIHSKRDRVISPLQIQQLAEHWELPSECVHILETVSSAETLDEDRRIYSEWCDDVQHDFIAKELIGNVLEKLTQYLQRF